MPRPECTHGSNAYKQVHCDRCGRDYLCTPGDDFYCAAEGDHCCEACLLSGAGVTEVRVLYAATASNTPTERS